MNALRSLKGNQRACVVTEPLWAVPYQLFLPFASVYMSAIGLGEAQIGTVASVGLAAQLVWALLSGALIDKYGRRRTMLVFGLLSWGIPCALWSGAQGYWYFVAAAVLNGMWRVTGNCFSCLIVEDGETDRLIHIYTLLSLMGLAAGFLTPLTGWFIQNFTLTRTMRVLYIMSMAVMSFKFILQYRLTAESSMGESRMAACKGRPLLPLALEGWHGFASAIKHRRLRLGVTLMVLMLCFNVVQANFWPLFITKAYGVSDAMLSLFPPAKAVITLAVFLLITPRVKPHVIKRPLLAALAVQGLGVALLLPHRPSGGLALAVVFLSAICDAFALAILGPVTESLMSRVIPAGERASINSFLTAGILLVSIPVGWLAGQLAACHRALPLLMNLCLVLAQAAVVLGIGSIKER